ncbi:heme oxygenase [Paenibacillus daejeonensis]|uniref:heme oxygenase n=1 Tax=Paenibacillus daejeonensis TaxID=135193 RepID=UPI00037C4248|nr:heme oxygenase [Paenibacillus daejeonensis]
MNAIQTDTLVYEAGRFRLHELSLEIPTGQITAIIGPNGSGKSTLLKLITTLIAPESGQIVVDGKAVSEYNRSQYARTLTMLPQAKDRLPELTVRELVAYGRSPHLRGLRQRLSDEDEQIIDWAMRVMSIRRHEERMFHTLSGGEQQKARIAMALAQKTGILLLDEPTTYMDIAHQLEVMRTLTRLNREAGITIVMVLHDLQHAAAFCDHLIAMKDGEVAASGAPKEVIQADFLREVYEIEARVSFEEQYPVIIPVVQPIEEESTMIIVTNISQITKGDGDKLIERFDRIGKVEAMEGFLGLEVLLTQNLKDHDEVSVVTRWRTKEDFQNWTRSEAFKESHAHRKTPEYIISNKITFQEVKVKRNPILTESQDLQAQAQ